MQQLLAAAAATLLMTGAAYATPVDFEAAPATVQVAPGSSVKLTFDPTRFATSLDPVSISTSGHILLAYDLFGPTGLEVSQFEPGSLIDGGLTYRAFATATAIPYSSSDQFIGFELTGGAKPVFGFAEIAGSIFLGDTLGAPGAGVTTAAEPIPEPSGAALLLTFALAGAGLAISRPKRS